MCNFFSFISDGEGNVYYFNLKQRETSENIRFDSHTTIATHYLKGNHADDRVNKYEYSKGVFIIDQINVRDDSKRVERWLKKFVKTEEFKKICLTSVEQDGYALQYVPDRLKTEEMCLAAVSQYGWVLKFVPDEFKTEKICLTSVEQDGYALQYVPDRLKTRELCFTAWEQDVWALEYAPDGFKTERICLTAVKQDGYILEFVPDELRTEKVCLAAVTQNGWALQFVPGKLKEKVKSMLEK